MDDNCCVLLECQSVLVSETWNRMDRVSTCPMDMLPVVVNRGIRSLEK